MLFVLPAQEHEKAAAAYIGEFWACGSPINGTGSLDTFLAESTYAKWLARLRAQIDIANTPAERVPSYTYFYMRRLDGKIVGMVNIRLALNHFLRTQGGHIGYSICPSERGKGYATRMLGETLAFLAPIGLTRIILTCGDGNLASARVIEKCGGKLEEIFYSAAFDEVIRRYTITAGEQA